MPDEVSTVNRVAGRRGFQKSWSRWAEGGSEQADISTRVIAVPTAAPLNDI